MKTAKAITRFLLLNTNNMKNEIKKSIQILLLATLIAFVVFSEKNETDAASMATLIGGTTGGVSDLCCNGIIVEFDSNFPTNMNILDGEALIVPLISGLYDSGNEMTEGYNTLGKVTPFGICVTIESECYSVEMMTQVISVGTSPGMAS